MTLFSRFLSEDFLRAEAILEELHLLPFYWKNYSSKPFDRAPAQEPEKTYQKGSY
jgi:hypothetical protein